MSTRPSVSTGSARRDRWAAGSHDHWDWNSSFLYVSLVSLVFSLHVKPSCHLSLLASLVFLPFKGLSLPLVIMFISQRYKTWPDVQAYFQLLR